MAGDKRDPKSGDAAGAPGEDRRDLDTLHDGERIPGDEDLDLPRHDSDMEIDPPEHTTK